MSSRAEAALDKLRVLRREIEREIRDLATAAHHLDQALAVLDDSRQQVPADDEGGKAGIEVALEPPAAEPTRYDPASPDYLTPLEEVKRIGERLLQADLTGRQREAVRIALRDEVTTQADLARELDLSPAGATARLTAAITRWKKHSTEHDKDPVSADSPSVARLRNYMERLSEEFDFELKERDSGQEEVM